LGIIHASNNPAAGPQGNDDQRNDEYAGHDGELNPPQRVCPTHKDIRWKMRATKNRAIQQVITMRWFPLNQFTGAEECTGLCYRALTGFCIARDPIERITVCKDLSELSTFRGSS